MTSPRRVVHWCASLTLAFGALVALGATPATAANPIGYVILQGEGQCGLATVDLVTGATQEIGNETAGKCAFDLEFSPDGSRLFGTRVVNGDPDTAVLVEFDLTSGDVTTLSQLGDFPVSGPGSSQGNLTFDNAGNLFTYLVPFPPDAASTAVDPACDGSAFCLFQVDQTDPTNLTYINHVPETFTVYYGLATSCAGATTSAHQAFGPSSAVGGTSWSDAAPSATSDETLASVNLTATGPATTDLGVITDTFVSSLDYDTDGTLYGVGFATQSQFPSLYTLDPSNGAPTEVHNLTRDDEPISIGVLGFAIAHPCAPTPTPPPVPPAPSPAVVITPRFTG
jgi:hypothetical protein